MTSVAPSFRAARVRFAVHADAVALGGLAVLTGFLAVATWGTWGDLDSDTGYDVVAGARVADGELPYRDFVYYYGPLAPFLAGLVSLLGGPGFWPAVSLGLVIALAIIAATYALARIVVGPLGAFLAAAITAAVAFIPNNYSFVLPHTFAATLGTLLVLLLLLAVWRYAATERSRWAAAVGLALGFVTLTKPEPAVAAVFAVALWLALRAQAGLGTRHVASLIAVPAAVIPAGVYGAFAAVASPRTLLLENLWPIDVLEAGGNTLVRARMPLSLGSVVDLGGRTIAYAIGCAVLVALGAGIGRSGRLRSMSAVGAGAACVLAVGVAAVKPDVLREGFYWAYGWVPAGALVTLGVLVWRFRRRNGPWPAAEQHALAAAVALAVLAATTYGVFVTHGWRPQMAVYYVPLAAVLLARLHLVELARGHVGYVIGVAWIVFLAAASIGLTLKDAREEAATVRGPGGALAETPAEASLYQAALDEIAARTESGEPILVSPLMTGLYVLSDRQSPLAELSLLPSALPTHADERAAIGRLDAAGVRLVVVNRREWAAYGQTSFGDSFQRLVAGWTERNFERVRTIRALGEDSRALEIWVRRVS